MKKWVFLSLVFLMILFSSSKFVYANVVWILGDFYKFSYTTENKNDSVEYTFYVEISGFDRMDFTYKPSIKLVDSTGYTHTLKDISKGDFTLVYDESLGKEVAHWTGVNSITSDIDVQRVYLKVYYINSDGTQENASINGDNVAPVITPTPKPTSTPTPKPTSTPTPKPTNIPTPTPTNVPTPKPTNTPTPTPTPTPLLELYAYTTQNDAVAQYKTGGFIPIKSVIEFYEIDKVSGSKLKLDSYEFLSGSGIRRNSLIPGKVYRYKLTYIYEQDGVQYEKFIWSNDLSIIDKELEDYRTNKKITNFRTLMIYMWEDFLALELPIEGFNISFQTLLIWFMVASAIVLLFKWYNK